MCPESPAVEKRWSRTNTGRWWGLRWPVFSQGVHGEGKQRPEAVILQQESPASRLMSSVSCVQAAVEEEVGENWTGRECFSHSVHHFSTFRDSTAALSWRNSGEIGDATQLGDCLVNILGFWEVEVPLEPVHCNWDEQHLLRILTARAPKVSQWRRRLCAGDWGLSWEGGLKFHNMWTLLKVLFVFYFCLGFVVCFLFFSWLWGCCGSDVWNCCKLFCKMNEILI